MIDAVNVVKRFDGFAALNHFNMHVPDGSVYGLIGPNGAGKSTIIRHVTGIYRPDSGEVSIDGRPVLRFSTSPRPPRRIWPGSIRGSIRDSIPSGLRN